MLDGDSVRIGAAQVSEVLFDLEQTLTKDIEFIEKAGKKGIELLVFPEYHLCGPDHWFYNGTEISIGTDISTVKDYYREMYDSAITVPGEATDRLGEAARRAGTVVVMGAIEKSRDDTGTLYNSQVYIDSDGELLGVRRKIMPTLTGKVFFKGGDGESIRTFSTSIGEISGLMCGEHTNPLAIYSLVTLGQQIHAASWPAMPWREPVKERYGLRTRYHALVGKIPAVLASGVVNEDLATKIGRPEWEGQGGASAVIAPDGTYLAGPKTDGEEGLVYADVTNDKWYTGKINHDLLGHYNRFDIFSLTVDRTTNSRIEIIEDQNEQLPRQDTVHFRTGSDRDS